MQWTSPFCWASRGAIQKENDEDTVEVGVKPEDSEVFDDDELPNPDSEVLAARQFEVKSRLVQSWTPLKTSQPASDRYVLQQIERITYERQHQKLTLHIEGVPFCLEDFTEEPVRFTAQVFEVTDLQFIRRSFDSDCLRLCDLLRTTRTTARWVHLDSAATCKPENINHLLRVLHAQHVNTGNFSCGDLMSQPYVMQMESIVTRGGNDAQLLSMTASYVNLRESDVTPQGINTYLKQYLNGEREIERFSIDFGKRNVSMRPPIREILADLKAKKIEDNRVRDANATVFLVARDRDAQTRVAVFAEHLFWILADGASCSM